MKSKEYLHEILEYRDGVLYWKESKRPGHRSLQIAGTKHSSGYKQISINRTIYLQHRIVFLMHHGFLPQYIDHIDRDRSNNRIENLREATARQNQANRSIGSNNSSGYRGVSFEKQTQKYTAGARLNGKHINLGRYSTPEQASKAYEDWAKEHFKEFAI